MMKALILSADNFEDTELLVPLYRLQEAGYRVEIASTQRGVIHGMRGYEVRAEKSFAEVDPAEYAVLVLPGGKAPAAFRGDANVSAIAHHFFEYHKPVGAICHGPQTLISAGLLSDRRATCYRTMARELEDAGAFYEDRDVVVDGHLVTSRQPEDLPMFMHELMRLLQHGRVSAPDVYWCDATSIPLRTEQR